jgi:hypothetical protein
MTLMVRNVNTMTLIAFRIANVTIKSTPSEAERPHKEIIEEPDIASNDNQSAYPPSP